MRFEIIVRLVDKEQLQPYFAGSMKLELSDIDNDDNELNAKRIAEQVVSELFQKYRDKG